MKVNDKQILDDLETVGFHHLKTFLTYDEFMAFSSRFGNIQRLEDVQMHLTPRSLHSPKGIGFHTDQDYVRYIGWFCVTADPSGGPTILFDSKLILDQMDSDQLELLSQVLLANPDPDRIENPTLVPMLVRDRERRFTYYSPWNLMPYQDVKLIEAWQNLHSLVEERAKTEAIEIALKPGESLFIDNKRLLHARGILPENSQRFLKRVWIGTPEWSAIRSKNLQQMKINSPEDLNPFYPGYLKDPRPRSPSLSQ